MKLKWLTLPEVLVLLFVWTGWLVAMVWHNQWYLWLDNWFMAVTMVAGSFIAGATSEGGGAVAFPVMTLIFGIEPAVARDFALMIQSVGMTAAAIAILYNRIPIEARAVGYASLGGAVGMVIGLEWVSPLLVPAASKLFFVTLWLSFGVALWWIFCDRTSSSQPRIFQFRKQDRLELLAVGLLGGIVSSITGSGLDLLTFALLVLVFRIDAKVATPTSVVLMAINAMVGFSWRLWGSASPIPDPAWHYWWVAVPVVVVGAPLGAKVIAHCSQTIVVALLELSIISQFLLALIILPLTPNLVLLSSLTFLSGLALFVVMAQVGRHRLRKRRHRLGHLPIPSSYFS